MHRKDPTEPAAAAAAETRGRGELERGSSEKAKRETERKEFKREGAPRDGAREANKLYLTRGTTS